MDKNSETHEQSGWSQTDHPAVDRFTARLIRRKARQLIGRAGFTTSDREDIEQELRLKLIKQLSAFDPKKANRRAFVVTVVERHIANLLRDKQAEKRDHRRVRSLHVLIAGDDGPEPLGDTIGDREHDARRGATSRDALELSQLTLDVADVIASMPPKLRELAEALKVDSVSEIARRRGVARSTLNESVRRIR